MNDIQEQLSTLRCFVTVDSDCSYLENHRSRNLVIDPDIDVDTDLLGALLNNGFRRSGESIYRPHCDDCHACQSLRVPVNQFQASRNQRRCYNKNKHLTHREHHGGFDEQHYSLYCRYIQQRHPGSSMEDPSKASFIEFLTSKHVETRFHEFYLNEQLVAVAVTDHTPLGLSAVYTFFEPELQHLSLGTYAILWQIEHCRKLGLPWLFLGYWIRNCPVMSYKNKFKPAEYFQNNQWKTLTT